MAKARAILKRRKAVRNIRKITKTMQMIATAKFQKSLRRVLATKPYTLKVCELVTDLSRRVRNLEHPMLRKVDGTNATNRVAVLVFTSDRGLAGAYNGLVIRQAVKTIRELEQAGKQVQLFVAGKKGHSYFSYQRRPFTKFEGFGDIPRFADAERVALRAIEAFVNGEIDAVHVVYMNFISTGVQRPDTMTLLPLPELMPTVRNLAQQLAEKEAQLKAGALDMKRRGDDVKAADIEVPLNLEYDFMPDARSLMDELLPLTVKTAFFQAVLDAKTSEHVARMVAMKAATDNATKMAKALTMEYNRARQSQITTELAEIMGGAEAMK
ncbi:MAG: ATP synthase F1 subunit gamma [Tepidisphaerales bacterium]